MSDIKDLDIEALLPDSISEDKKPKPLRKLLQTSCWRLIEISIKY